MNEYYIHSHLIIMHVLHLYYEENHHPLRNSFDSRVIIIRREIECVRTYNVSRKLYKMTTPHTQHAVISGHSMKVLKKIKIIIFLQSFNEPNKYRSEVN